MNGAPPLTDAIDVLRRERRVSDGPVPNKLDRGSFDTGWAITPEAFLVRHEQFAAIYRKGEGITLDRGTAAPGMIDLWLNGTIYAAIACLNGLFPIHASAVAVGNKLYAFTGPSGGGKSTLVTALGQLGLPLFCDDTLVLDLRGDALLALPGHKRVKLWPESLALLGMEGTELVSDDYRKFFISTSASDVAEPRKLSGLIHLEWGDEIAWRALSASERFVAFDDDHYTWAKRRSVPGATGAMRNISGPGAGANSTARSWPTRAATVRSCAGSLRVLSCPCCRRRRGRPSAASGGAAPLR